jgi:hypothetical protein
MKLLSVFFFLTTSIVSGQTASKNDFIGAWEAGSEENRTTTIYADGYFATTEYDLKNKKFVNTFGGVWRLENNKLIEVREFDVLKPENIGKEVIRVISLKKNQLIFADGSVSFSKLDDGTPGKLAGAWLITGRMSDDGMRTITPGVRKTMKILSGTRFQWIAYNTETKEFLGTGGGTYTTNDGKYVENIQFFSRDNSRVGASLSFEFSIEDGNWRHRGLSSKGDPIDEIWSLRKE